MLAYAGTDATNNEASYHCCKPLELFWHDTFLQHGVRVEWDQLYRKTIALPATTLAEKIRQGREKDERKGDCPNTFQDKILSAKRGSRVVCLLEQPLTRHKGSAIRAKKARNEIGDSSRFALNELTISPPGCPARPPDPAAA